MRSSKAVGLAAQDKRNHGLASHLPALDGLRGCAILLVLFFHLFRPAQLPAPLHLLASVGWVGVDLFFVLSGFLITTILLRTRTATNYYKVFYVRRVLRIAPVYYLALLWIFLGEPLVYHHLYPHRFHPFTPWQHQIWYWFNCGNLHSAFFPMDVLLATPYWSLGVEEQFYAFWPIVARRLNDRALAITALAGMAALIVLRCIPALQQLNTAYPNFFYRFPPFHFDGLFAGAFLAVFLQRNPTPRHVRLLSIACLVTGSLMLALMDIERAAHPTLFSEFGYTALALLFASCICSGAYPTGAVTGAFSRVMSFRVLRLFGKYSYFLYVFHLIIESASTTRVQHRWTSAMSPALASIAAPLLVVGLCFIAAVLSWHLMEKPVLSLKSRFPYSFADRKRHATTQGIPDPGI